jgi:hypothetical protein
MNIILFMGHGTQLGHTILKDNMQSDDTLLSYAMRLKCSCYQVMMYLYTIIFVWLQEFLVLYH